MGETNKTHRKPQRRGLSKSRLMAHRQCPKRLWLATYKAELLDESGAESAFAFGNQIGDVARQLHPGGHLIEGNNLSETLRATTARLEERPRKPLFEATFDFQHTLIRADLLLPMPTGYRLVEVKASTSVKPNYIEDVAIQAWVMEKAGVRLSRLELAHVNNQFVYPGNADYRGLLTYADVASEVRPLMNKVGGWVDSARKTLAGTEPDIEPGKQCTDPYPCPFMAYCWPSAEGGYPLSDLPRGGRMAETLTAEGFTDLRDVPAERLSNEHHLMVHRAVKTGKPIIDPVAGQLLHDLAWPRYYLDFETIQFALPVWVGTRPYQQIPFQWSCHIESRNGEVSHHEFLAEGDGGDPRRAFVESLVNSLGDTGPIFVYNATFELTRMTELAEAFPEFAAALNAALARFVDLLPIVRDHYYHPDQHGSWSLKRVLPTIAPELDYAELDVAEGGAAAETFRKLLDPNITAEDAAKARAGLIKYCGRDTLALVRIAQFFQQRSI